MMGIRIDVRYMDREQQQQQPDAEDYGGKKTKDVKLGKKKQLRDTTGKKLQSKRLLNADETCETGERTGKVY